jgi:3-mercaptopyruvate sulfurtransferase SseA
MRTDLIENDRTNSLSRDIIKPMKNIFVFLLAALALSSCQLTPTKVKEHLTVGPNPDRARVITDKTIILDVRPLFAFTAGHIPNAQNVRWDFYGQKNNPGKLRNDLSSITRELARLGVAPEKHVVVVGLGQGGNGEEGRVAWMLTYLGVNNTSFARESFFTLKRKVGDATPNENVAAWEPQPDPTFIVDKKELSTAMKNPANYSIIDVRNVDEYLGKHPESPVRPDIGALNVPWTEFIDGNGLPNKSIARKLTSIGITPTKRVVLISDEGVRSALATQVLRELGYNKAGNFAGGFQELFPSRKK